VAVAPAGCSGARVASAEARLAVLMVVAAVWLWVDPPEETCVPVVLAGARVLASVAVVEVELVASACSGTGVWMVMACFKVWAKYGPACPSIAVVRGAGRNLVLVS
jgi:hypothetical protein